MRKLISQLAGDGVFEPESIGTLVDAFDDAWRSLQTSGAPFAEETYAAVAREILAKQIIKAAKNGERDRRQLAEGALLQLARANLRRSRRAPDPAS